MSEEEQEQTIAEDLVVTKYKMGGDIANRKLNAAAAMWLMSGTPRLLRSASQLSG